MSIVADILKQLGPQGAMLLLLVVVLLLALMMLLGLRLGSKIKTENAADARQSRYEERRDEETASNAKLLEETRAELVRQQAANIRLRNRMEDQTLIVRNALDRLKVDRPEEADLLGRFVRDSTLAAFDDKPMPPAPKIGRRQR